MATGSGRSSSKQVQEKRKGHVCKGRPATSLLTLDTPRLQMHTDVKAGPAPSSADATLHRTQEEHTCLEKEDGTRMQDLYEVFSPSVSAQGEGWSILHIMN